MGFVITTKCIETKIWNDNYNATKLKFSVYTNWLFFPWKCCIPATRSMTIFASGTPLALKASTAPQKYIIHIFPIHFWLPFLKLVPLTNVSTTGAFHRAATMPTRNVLASNVLPSIPRIDPGIAERLPSHLKYKQMINSEYHIMLLLKWYFTLNRRPAEAGMRLAGQYPWLLR